MLELTTRFVGITTGKRANGKQLTGRSAANQAKANLRYILRESATMPDDLITLNINGECTDRKQLQKLMSKDIELRASSGGKRGSRIAEKIIFSLPNDMQGRPARDAVRLISDRLANGSPNVKIIAAIHTDRPDNLHVHLLVLDGLETVEMAQNRTSVQAKRVRPRYVLRMGDRGRPKEVRRLIAEAINDVAERHGLRKVECRSFKERGISKSRHRHDGPQKRARLAKAREAAFWSESFENIKDVFSDPEPPARRVTDPTVDTMWNLLHGSARALQIAQRGLSR